MTSLLARLALVPEPIAFNLAVAWLVAGTGTGAFGFVFNLLRIQKVRRGALVLGLTAADRRTFGRQSGNWIRSGPSQ